MIKDISRQHPFGLRIPEDLKSDLEKAAVASARSLNAEMVHRLKQSFTSPLSEHSDGDLIRELINRYPRGNIQIHIGPPSDSLPSK
jgi:hypothetical protein